MEIIIDFVGFERANGKFVVNELCTTDICDEVGTYRLARCEHWLFELFLDQVGVAAMQKSVDLCGHHHSISWILGMIPYKLLKEMLKIMI